MFARTLLTRVAAMFGSVLLVAALASPLAAAVPATSQVEGVLRAAGGVPAADGAYQLTFALYDGLLAKSPVWTEGPVEVQVVGGRFGHALGSSKALDAAVLGGLAAPYLGVQVGSDPELPRQALRAAPYALVAGSLACVGCVAADSLANGGVSAAKVGFNYAGSNTKGGAALDVSCTGCVSVAELAFDEDVDLGGNSLKAKNGTFTGDVSAKSVTATTFVGDGSKLSGIPMPTGACPKGQSVTGIAADGKLVCQPMAGALPADGLATVSNGLLSNQFQDKITAKDLGVAIPDNTGATAVSTLVFPDIGVAQTFAVTIELANTDLSSVAVVLLPPDDKKQGVVVCDPCGKDDTAKALVIELPKTAPQSGDLGKWVGQNPKGEWTLKVTDTGFCLPQKPGNDKLCDTVAKTDGSIVTWSIAIQTLSNQKVSTAKDSTLIAGGGVQLADLDPAKVTCDAAHFGLMFASSKTQAFYVCNGKELRAFALDEQGTKANPALSCWDLRQKQPFVIDGVYWLDPDAGGPGTAFQAYCDMSTDGGGWTLVWSNLRGGTGKFETAMKWATATTTTPLVKGSLGDDIEQFQVYTGLAIWKQLLAAGQGEWRYTWANDYKSPIDHAHKCKLALNGTAYTLALSGCSNLKGGVTPGIVAYHNGKDFRAIDSDATGCSLQYSNTPWWYVSCWDGSINGGGQNSGGGYYNGAYWVNSAKQWGADNGQGAGNGWMWVR